MPITYVIYEKSPLNAPTGRAGFFTNSNFLLLGYARVTFVS